MEATMQVEQHVEVQAEEEQIMEDEVRKK